MCYPLSQILCICQLSQKESQVSLLFFDRKIFSLASAFVRGVSLWLTERVVCFPEGLKNVYAALPHSAAQV